VQSGMSYAKLSKLYGFSKQGFSPTLLTAPACDIHLGDRRLQINRWRTRPLASGIGTVFATRPFSRNAGVRPHGGSRFNPALSHFGASL
jgi:hypothetical protein